VQGQDIPDDEIEEATLQFEDEKKNFVGPSNDTIRFSIPSLREDASKGFKKGWIYITRYVRLCP
jgi:hypothetical protein